MKGAIYLTRDNAGIGRKFYNLHFSKPLLTDRVDGTWDSLDVYPVGMDPEDVLPKRDWLEPGDGPVKVFIVREERD